MVFRIAHIFISLFLIFSTSLILVCDEEIKVKIKIPIHVENSYNLPAWVDKNTLVFVISYSGNTEETLSCLKQAISKGLKTIAISSDGKLEEIAKPPFIKAPSNFQPRAATPYLFIYLLEVCKKIGLCSPDYEDLLDSLKKLNLKIESKNIAKEIAKGIKGKFIFIHVPRHLEAAGRRWQAQCLNENAKVLAKFSVIPESNHNELTAWGECDDLPLASVFLWDDEMDEKIKARMKFTMDICKEKGDVFVVKVSGTLLSKLMSLVYIGDMVGYYLSLLRHKDPLPVPLVKELKKYLRNI